MDRSLIFLFSILGIFIRTSLSKLYSKSPDFPSQVYYQILGCFLLGFISRNKLYLSQHLYDGLSIGLCGSITSFSTFILSAFNLFIQKQAFSAIVLLINVLSCSFSFYKIGCNISLERFSRCKFLDWTLNDRILNSLIAVSFLTTVITFISLASLGNTYLTIFIIGPFGSLIRSELLIFNTSNFPRGTLYSNFFATVLLSIILTVSYFTTMPCFVFDAFTEGICGCLSTISTFMKELDELDTQNAIIYFSMSIIVCLGSILVISGIPFLLTNAQRICT